MSTDAATGPTSVTTAPGRYISPKMGGTIVHGVFGRDGCYMPCNKCPYQQMCPDLQVGIECPREQEYMAQRVADVGRLEWIDPTIDGPAVMVLIWQEIRIIRAARYLAAVGELVEDVNGYPSYSPLAGEITKLTNSWGRHLERLGLTPKERRKLAARGDAGPASRIAAVIRELQQDELADQDPVDAEFEVEDES